MQVETKFDVNQEVFCVEKEQRIIEKIPCNICNGSGTVILWSVLGATKMSELRAYYLNGGDMLELVRYQEKELPMAAGMENQILLSSEIIRSERNRHGQIGKYVESINHSVDNEIRKCMPFKALLSDMLL